jgi:hypothetical protein
MPQAAQPGCPICGGTGLITDPQITRLTTRDRSPGDPVRCLCTVSDAEIDAGLPGMFAEILAKSPPSKT